MAEPTYLVSALVTGLFLVATATALGRSRWLRRYSPDRGRAKVQSARTGRPPMPRSPAGSAAWLLGLLVVAVALGAGVVLSAGGTGGVGALGSGPEAALALLLAGTLGSYLFWGVYHAACGRGWNRAQAAALSAWVFGVLLVVAIVVRLVTGG